MLIENCIERVILKTLNNKIWFYSLSITPEKARELFENKTMVKAEGIYKSLYNANSLGESYLIDHKSKRHQLVSLGLKLRSYYLTLSETEAISMMKQKGVFDATYNTNSEFENQFELLEIDGDTVLLDYETNLAWHTFMPQILAGEVDDSFDGEIDSPINKALNWLKKQNKKGYAHFYDWRLPTIEEAAYLLERVKNQHWKFHNSTQFHNAKYILTGDEDSHGKRWIVDYKNRRIHAINNDYQNPETADLNIIVVRSNQ